MYSYATLTELLYQHNQTTNSNQSLSESEQAKLLDFGRRASKVIEGRTDSIFVPELWAWQYPSALLHDRMNGLYHTLRLPRPLCELDSFVIGDTTLETSTYRLFPPSMYPSYEVQKIGNWSGGNSTNLIGITGIWVNRSRYDRDAWVDSNDTVQDDPLSSSATTINVSSVNGADANNVSPRFTAGMVIRIEDEYCIVTDTTYIDNSDPTPDTNTLTVIRGALGTTATAHDQATQIDVFKVEPEIVRACMLTAAFNYANVGQYKRVEFNTATGANETRMEIPDEAVDIIARFRRKYVKGF